MYYYQYSYILSNFAHLWASVDHNQKYWWPSFINGFRYNSWLCQWKIYYCLLLKLNHNRWD